VAWVQPYLSVIVPAYNEEGAIAPLCGEIMAVAAANGIDMELLVVDDCSSDRTYEEAKSVPGTQVIHLRRNCGQSTAIEVGIRSAQGKFVVMLDGDGQNDPADIPRMLERAFVLIPLAEIAPDKVSELQLLAVAKQAIARL
jgi:dolichol-phosphate mannosyltransferase